MSHTYSRFSSLFCWICFSAYHYQQLQYGVIMYSAETPLRPVPFIIPTLHHTFTTFTAHALLNVHTTGWQRSNNIIEAWYLYINVVIQPLSLDSRTASWHLKYISTWTLSTCCFIFQACWLNSDCVQCVCHFQGKSFAIVWKCWLCPRRPCTVSLIFIF